MQYSPHLIKVPHDLIEESQALLSMKVDWVLVVVILPAMKGSKYHTHILV